jgi:O-antigen ligase
VADRWTIPDFARAAFFALLPAIAIGGAMALPVLTVIAGLASLRPSLLRQVLEKRPLAIVLLAAFAVWAALSSLWSDWDGPTAGKVLPLLALGLAFAAAAVANERAARLSIAGALATFAVLAPLLAIEATMDMPLNRIAAPHLPEGELNRNPGRGLVVLLAVTWPCVAALVAAGTPARRIAAGMVVVVGGTLSLQFGQLSTAIGFGVGLIAFAIAFATPALLLRVISAGLAGWMMLAPFLTPLLVSSPRLVEAVPLSWAARIAIWRYTCEQILAQPWIGHGLDAGRAVSDRIAIRGLEMRGVPVHPHSASLQIWFETGVVGAALVAALIGFGGWRLARGLEHDKPAAAAAAAVLAMFGLIANVGWSVWQEWWMATLLLTAGLVGAVAARGARA